MVRYGFVGLTPVPATPASDLALAGAVVQLARVLLNDMSADDVVSCYAGSEMIVICRSLGDHVPHVLCRVCARPNERRKSGRKEASSAPVSPKRAEDLQHDPTANNQQMEDAAQSRGDMFRV
jgi:hypothetical protein